MAERSAIEWTDSTFNPWIGCTKVSPACDHCYAEALAARRFGLVEWGGERKRTSASTWAQPLRWQKQAAEFYARHGRRRRVFCASLADVFDNHVPVHWRSDLWRLIRETPDLDWLLLTKRPQNIGRMLPEFWDEVRGHVWLGTTVEDQRRAEVNIPHLLKHDAAVRFVSCEPLLGPVNLLNIRGRAPWARQPLVEWAHFSAFDSRLLNRIEWVICGGESGLNARPTHPDWVRSLRYQCGRHGVPFFFKQWGEWVGGGPGRIQWSDCRELKSWGGGCYSARVGKARAGRLLDGRQHDEFPKVRQFGDELSDADFQRTMGLAF